MGKESIQEIMSKIGEGKRWASLDDLIKECEDTCEVLWPMAYMTDGYFGWKFNELLPKLKDIAKAQCETQSTK